jgi:glutathione S-transferase
MGTVPTLVHNNIKITESIAILAYLCENYNSIPSSYYGTNL